MYSAVIVAAGSGTRFGTIKPKVLTLYQGKPLIQYSLDRFLEDLECKEIILVYPENSEEAFEPFRQRRVTVVIGGKMRQESVRRGLALVKEPWVLIHDGARPNLSKGLLERIKTALKQEAAVAPAIAVADTLKECASGKIVGDIERDRVFQIQTPQAFRTESIRSAHEKAFQANHLYSDDTSVYQHELALPVTIVAGEATNIKVTTLTDILILEAIR
jgi:2-C-methyl-D-erythritol 4-phosphate cytidylyltransferase